MMVALRKESVDRNLWWGVRKAVGSLVALRKESVDRNIRREMSLIRPYVALRKESVDRNHAVCADHHKRRVALRKESVDRNCSAVIACWRAVWSLSARRAWIEILIFNFGRLHNYVALRKESVDRNLMGFGCLIMIGGRSPQGERG